MQFKQKVYDHYVQLLDDKISAIEKILSDLKESGANETKSTAGDKHETALAMLQIEQANKRAQLQELQAQKAVMNKIDPAVNAVQIVNGSLIKTNQGYFFMSVALGKTVVDDHSIFALSSQSPLGKNLLGLKKGAIVSFNQTQYFIEEIL
jgi:transcription elongation GreA/GreB family factor